MTCTAATVRSETPAEYLVPCAARASSADDAIIARALEILGRRLQAPGAAIGSPTDAQNFVKLKLAELQHEVFAVLFLDAQHCVISFQEMFRGTLTQASVYPREVVKAALALNAASVILAHNHPSGNPEPSRADEALTAGLKSALALVDVRVLDHLVVGGLRCVSFAERGMV